MTRANGPASDPELQARYRDVLRDPSSVGEHASEETWVRFSCDELTGDEQARLADHILACSACAELFRAVAEVRVGASAFDPDAPPVTVAPDSTAPVWYRLAAAAVLVVVLGSAAWWQMSGRPNGVSLAQVESPTPVPAAASERPAAVVVPALPAWAALPVAPAVSLPAALTLVVRGASSDSEAFMEAFGVAITPYREARYADAATALEGVTRQFPQVAEGWFYLGVARLLSERAGDAVEPLRRARGSEVVGEHARWIEAVALARAGRADEAATALQAMCESRGSHRAGACEALRAGR